MAIHTINVSLDERSIQKAIQELEQYKRDFYKKLDILAMRLAREGMYLARAYLMEYKDEEYVVGEGEQGISSTGVRINDLINSINYQAGEVITDGYTYYVFTGNDCAKYVEFGTGIIGKQNPHDKPDAGWVYDYKNHGDSGWFYVSEATDGKSHWTKGVPSRPFMYKTAMQLAVRASEIAREVFG